MERDRKEYRDRLLYESRLHREHAAARENRTVMEHGDDGFQTSLTPTKEQMYLDIIKELERKLEESEAMRQESASQQSLDRLLEMLAAKESSIEKLTEELRLSRERSAEQIKILQQKSAAEIKSLSNELSSFRVAMERMISNKDAELQLLRNQLYGKKSQKGRRTKRSKDQDDDNQDRDNFDGTPKSLSQGSKPKTSNNKSATELESESESEVHQTGELTGKVVKKAIRPEKYNTMKAAKVKEHKCDISQLPEGYKFIRYRIVKEFTHISYVQEDRYHVAVVKNKEGRFEEFYTPQDKSDTSMPRENIVKGTHATPELLAFMVVNKYLLHTPINRQMYLFENDKGQFSQQTVANYYTKAYDQMSVLKSHLESILKKVGSFIHCDETWVRVRVKDESEATEEEIENGLCPTKLVKRYMWTIVNEAEKITYFLYSSGSRGGEVIKSFLREFKGALQSDGYVAYKYFDREDVPTEHLVCMAHVRAKFKDAQMSDTQANYFVDQIGKLYLIEMYNKIEGLSDNDIYRRRKTEAMPILNDMKRRAEEFLKTDGGVASDKMYTAVNYMLNFWRELINYTNEGHYTIDNSAAERSIRPLTIGRKNYIHFGSEKSAEVAAFFYSIMATCKMRGENARDYIAGFM